MSNHNENTNPFLFKSRFCDEISKISWTRVIEGPNKMKSIKKPFFFFFFSPFLYSVFFTEFCSNGSSIIIFRHLYQKFRYRFKSNFQKFTWYTKLKIRKHLYRQAQLCTTLTQKHNFAEKMTTIYAIVLLSIRFLYRSP